MKNIYILICIILSFCMFTGCDIVDETKLASNEKSVEIIRCFDEHDINGLKQLFCHNSQARCNLDAQIEYALEFYDGTSDSYELHYGGAAGGWDNGECIDKHITPQIRNVRTNSENVFRIVYHEYVIYKADEKCVGITYMRIFNESTNQMVQIGEYVY